MAKFDEKKTVKNTAATVDNLLSRSVSDNKRDVRKAQNVKKKSFGSWFSNATRKLNSSESTPEDLALLGSKMHFDAKEAYKLLRTNVLFCLPDSTQCRTIGITSSIRGEGKSTASINLAYTFAVTGAEVLLVDMDMRLPTISKKLGIESNVGLSDYLIGNANIKDIIHTMKKYDNWDIMLSGSIPPAPSELIGSEAMKELMNKLKKHYDFIIVDLPPVNIVSDALVAKEILDGYVLVVRQDFSDKHSLADCTRQLAFLNANILGFVMTDADSRARYSKKYGRKYGGYYKRKYGYYRRYDYYNNYGYNKYYGNKSEENNKQ